MALHPKRSIRILGDGVLDLAINTTVTSATLDLDGCESVTVTVRGTYANIAAPGQVVVRVLGSADNINFDTDNDNDAWSAFDAGLAVQNVTKQKSISIDVRSLRRCQISLFNPNVANSPFNNYEVWLTRDQ